MDPVQGNIAIVGGTGFEQLPAEIFAEPLEVQTRFGPARILSVSFNYIEPHKLYFLSRHGTEHGTAPHQINYRANIAALAERGVTAIFASNAVGSLRTDLLPGSLVLLDDFIDFTRGRPQTYYAENMAWRHVDFSQPYSARLRGAVREAARAMAVPLRDRGTYLCCDGPRFESPAEVRLFAHWGADVVGMTGLPEAIFAREAGMEYAGLAVVTNLAAGLSTEPVDHEANTAAMRERLDTVRELFLEAATRAVGAPSTLRG